MIHSLEKTKDKSPPSANMTLTVHVLGHQGAHSFKDRRNSFRHAQREKPKNAKNFNTEHKNNSGCFCHRQG